MSNLVVGQINARHSNITWALLERAILSNSYNEGLDVLLVQEPPPLALSEEGRWRGFQSFVAKGTNPLTMIMVRMGLEASQVDIQGDRVCGAEVKLKVGSILLFSAYIRYGNGEGADLLGRALTKSQELTPLRLVGMDSNGHSPLWGPEKVELDTVGELVEDVLGEGDLLVVNHCDPPPTFLGDRGQTSWIDITAASPALAARIVDWRVDTSVEVASDHRLIMTRIWGKPQKAVVRQRPSWRDVDWVNFSRHLRGELTCRALALSCQNPKEIDLTVASLSEALESTIRCCVPIRRLCQYSRPWWTPELSHLRNIMTRLRRRWMRRGTVQTREEYLRARSLFRRSLREEKREAWRRLCAETSSTDYWTMFRRLFRKRGQILIEDFTQGDEVISTDAEKARVLTTTFFPSLPAVTSPAQERVEHAWRTHRPPGPEDSELVTPLEVLSAIRAMRMDAAPGLDGIPVICLKKCCGILLPWLRQIFSSSLALGYFPEKWRIAKVLALRKPGKASYATPRSYRPISLLSNMSKLLETIVNRRLMRYVESRCLLSPEQFGFRAGREVMGACTSLVEDVTAAFCRRLQVHVVALDIQAAYDSVWKAGLLEKLVAKGVSGTIISWVQSFLSRRRSILEVGTSRVEVAPECGVPQGSPLSPTLFLIYIDDLLHHLARLGRVRFQAFADDLIVWVTGDFRLGVMDPGLQRALRLAEEWAAQWRLCFSPQKCECICFCAANVRIQRTFDAQLYGEALPHVHSLRYLGVWFDEHLTWDRHVREAVARARGRLWELRRCVGTEWGVHPPWFLRMVRGAILPALFYGAPCWAAVLSSSGRLAQLDGVLALAGRLAFGLERTTSGEACRMLAGLFSARQYIMQSLVCYMWRQHQSVLQVASLPRVPEHYVTPQELGRAWFIRAVRGHTLVTPLPRRRRLIFEGVDRALRLELQRSWEASDRGRMLYEVLPRVGREWQPLDIDRVPRRGVTLVARFLTGHCHLGGFSLPWDPLESVPCPLCGGEFSREHLLWECSAVSA